MARVIARIYRKARGSGPVGVILGHFGVILGSPWGRKWAFRCRGVAIVREFVVKHVLISAVCSKVVIWCRRGQGALPEPRKTRCFCLGYGLLWPPGVSWGHFGVILGSPRASSGILGSPGASWGLMVSPGPRNAPKLCSEAFLGHFAGCAQKCSKTVL